MSAFHLTCRSAGAGVAAMGTGVLLLATSACGLLPEPREALTSAVQIPALDGRSVRVEGRVVRPILGQVSGQGPTGTALELPDGALVWVSDGTTLPAGWEHTEGAQVTVDCKVWQSAPPGVRGALAGPHLSECSVPTRPRP